MGPESRKFIEKSGFLMKKFAGTVLFVTSFAKNFNCDSTAEIQLGHWKNIKLMIFIYCTRENRKFVDV